MLPILQLARGHQTVEGGATKAGRGDGFGDRATKPVSEGDGRRVFPGFELRGGGLGIHGVDQMTSHAALLRPAQARSYSTPSRRRVGLRAGTFSYVGAPFGMSSPGAGKPRATLVVLESSGEPG